MTSAFLLACVVGQLPREDVIRPADYAPCGLSSFYLVCRFLDVPIQWDEAKSQLGPADKAGMHSFQNLVSAAKSVGLHPVAVKGDLAQLAKLPMPVIVHVRDPRRPNRPEHLLVLLRVQDQRVILLDPPMPAYSLSADNFAAVWTGHALAFAHDEDQVIDLVWSARSTSLVRPFLWSGAVLGMLAAFIVSVRFGRARTNRLNRTLLTSLAVAMAVGFTATAIVALMRSNRTPDRPDGPTCVIVEPSQDLGELSPGESSARVLIRNDGTRPLAITGVRSSCTCVSAIEKPKPIEPGETGEVALDLKIGRGPQNVKLWISSDGFNGEQQASLEWHARSRPTLEPVCIMSDLAGPDVPFEKLLTLVYAGGSKALKPRLESVECSSPDVTVLEGTNNANAARITGLGSNAHVFGELKLHLTVRPQPAGTLVETTGTVVIRQGGQQYRLGFFLSVRFLGGKYAPESTGVVFASSHPADLIGKERTMRVASRAGNLELTSLPDWLACDVKPDDGGYRLHFRVLQSPPISAVHHAIQVGDKGEPTSRIPIIIHCLTSE